MAYPAHVRRELELTRSLKKGSRGNGVKRVQEWLTLHRFATTVDGDFGNATARAVKEFQNAHKLPVSGQVGSQVWQELIAPLQCALQPVPVPASADLPDIVLKVVRQHLAQHPLEVGGANRGPWVRVYIGGHQGSDWYWCAGFISFVLRQACALMQRPMPLPGSYSCDALAYQARERGLFVAGRDMANGTVDWSSLGAAQIFLVRRSARDWTHTGICYAGDNEVFCTVEGNTNDDGSRNGFEVCWRTRSVAGKDFIRLDVA